MRFAGVVLTIAVATMPASAQTPGAILSGTVRAQAAGPLDGASVEILGTSFRQTTGAAGSYQFDNVPPGRYWILVRRIGYSPERVSATLAEGRSRQFPFILEPLPARLSELTVLAESGMSRPRFQDFQARAHAAFGDFLTRDDLAGAPGDLIAVAQRYLPGRSRFTLEQHAGGPGAGVLLRRVGYYVANDGSVIQASRYQRTRDCAPAISANGSRPIPGLSLADFDRDQVEALEIYQRGNWVPTEFAYQSTTGCGLVVVWLR